MADADINGHPDHLEEEAIIAIKGAILSEVARMPLSKYLDLPATIAQASNTVRDAIYQREVIA